jgi:putative transposase
VINPAVDDLAALTSVKRACELPGRPRGSHFRAQQPTPARAAAPRPTPPNALIEAERQQVLDVLTGDWSVDTSVAQTWATLLDEGTYLCSMSTMHRILRAHRCAGERRRRAVHPPRARPELVAAAPGHVWSWDITRLAGRARGVYYDLYVVLDILSRFVVAWTVAAREDSHIGTHMLSEAMGTHGIPRAVHADRGTSMTSKPVAQLLLDLGVTRSHSRPHVTNDNPCSEAAFQTLKYAPAFPDRFGSLADARESCEEFFSYDNHEHRHCGIGVHPRIGPLRHRRPGPRPTAADPRRRLRRPPPPLRTTPPAGPRSAHRRLDQPTLTGGTHTDRLNDRASAGLTSSAASRVTGGRRGKTGEPGVHMGAGRSPESAAARFGRHGIWRVPDRAEPRAINLEGSGHSCVRNPPDCQDFYGATEEPGGLRTL